MSMTPKGRRPVGRQVSTPAPSAKAPRSAAGLAPPHERDESIDAHVDPVPDLLMEQAGRDIAAGLVDTDMHSTPGMDATLRGRLVPGPSGKAPPAKT